MGVWGLGFKGSGFRFWVQGLGVWAPRPEPQTPSTKPQTLNLFSCGVGGLSRRLLNLRLGVQGLGVLRHGFWQAVFGVGLFYAPPRCHNTSPRAGPMKPQNLQLSLNHLTPQPLTVNFYTLNPLDAPLPPARLLPPLNPRIRQTETRNPRLLIWGLGLRVCWAHPILFLSGPRTSPYIPEQGPNTLNPIPYKPLCPLVRLRWL